MYGLLFGQHLNEMIKRFIYLYLANDKYNKNFVKNFFVDSQGQNWHICWITDVQKHILLIIHTIKIVNQNYLSVNIRGKNYFIILINVFYEPYQLVGLINELKLSVYL